MANDIHSESASRTLDYSCRMFPFLLIQNYLIAYCQMMTTPFLYLRDYLTNRLTKLSSASAERKTLSPFTILTVVSWRHGMPMDLGQEKMQDGQKVINGHTPLMSFKTWMLLSSIGGVKNHLSRVWMSISMAVCRFFFTRLCFPLRVCQQATMIIPMRYQPSKACTLM